MARAPKPPASEETSPTELPEVEPYRRALDQGWVIESLMQIQGSVQSLTTEVRGLAKTLDDQGKKLDKLRITVYSAAAVIAVLVALGSFFVTKGIDILIGLSRH